MMMATRRLTLRPASLALLCNGRVSPRPATIRRAGAMPRSANRRTTLAARAADSSQLERNSAVLIGRSSV